MPTLNIEVEEVKRETLLLPPRAATADKSLSKHVRIKYSLNDREKKLIILQTTHLLQ